MIMKCKLLILGGCLIVLTAFNAERPKNIFLLGDSISLQYGPYLEKYLGSRFNIQRKNSDSSAFKNLDIPVGANGGDSKMVLDHMRQAVKDPEFRPDVMLLNCGLHDIKRDHKTQKIAVEEGDYRKNLEAIYQLVSAKKILLIWIRTTGIVDSIHRKNGGFDRYEKDLKKYNAIADQVFSAHQVPEIDLFTITDLQGPNRFVDHAHFKPEVRAVQAAYIAGFVRSWAATSLNMTKFDR
jgi:lysophospholipase L1-like esterase